MSFKSTFQDEFNKLYQKFYLIPVKDGSKEPLVSLTKWANKKIPVAEFKFPRFGIIGGYDGLEIIDIDNKQNNAEYHYQLIKDHCNVDNMPHVATPSGGYHIYYKSPGNVDNAQKLAQKWDGVKVNDKGKAIPDTLIETRCKNTYVVAPPSEGYKVINGSLFNVPYISKDERDFIIEFCKAQNEYIAESKIKGEFNSNKGEIIGEKSGDRFNTEGLSEIISLLKQSGWKSTYNDIYWTRPGKEKGISATLGKCKGKSGNPLFHVFTTSSEFGDTNYTMFGLYTEMVHGGDYKKAAKELGDRYGIKPVYVNKEKHIQKAESVNVETSEDGGESEPNETNKKNDIHNYIRVGNNFFKKIDGELERWSRQNIIDDFGKDAIRSISKFDKFVNEPSHIDYKAIIYGNSHGKDFGKFYNKYSKPTVYPSDVEGDFPKIKILLTHLFGKRYELALDWIQISYLNPLQRLPIICLVGEENETGKSGFGRLMRYIYQDNFASIKISEYRSEFNSSYIEKNIICLEEGKMSDEDVDRLKKDSSEDYAFLRQMHIDRVKIRHFAKYILTSNRVNDFIKVSRNDNRFWIEKIGKFPSENFDPLFDEKIKKEITYFLNFLFQRELVVKEKEGRFWIGPERYIGAEFYNLLVTSRDENINQLYYKMLDYLDDNFHTKVQGSAVKIHEWFGGNNYKLNSTVIRKAILTDFPDIVEKYGRYNKHDNNTDINSFRGTYFIITVDMLKKVLGIDYDLDNESPISDNDPFSANKNNSDSEDMPF